MEKQKSSRGLTRKGKSDMRLTVNREKLGGFNIDGSLDKRLKANRTPKSSSKETKAEENSTSNPKEKAVPGIPRKEDGTPDMCSKVNKTISGSSPSSCTDRSSSGESIGPPKSDSTPEEKCSADSSGDSSGSSSYVLVGCSSACTSDNQRGTFKCTRRCKTCNYVSNQVNISGPNGSVDVNDHMTCISTNIIYCITCTKCGMLYIGETGKRLADRFCQHVRDVERNASKPVARHFNLPDHSQDNMTVCGLSLHHGDQESRRRSEGNFICQLGTLHPQGINKKRPSIGPRYAVNVACVTAASPRKKIGGETSVSYR